MSLPTHLTFVPRDAAHATRGSRDGPPMILGLIHPNAAAIHVDDLALRQIIEYSDRDFEREMGGFLLGEVSRDDPPHVRVRHFLPATEARSQSARLTFTHESWASLNRQAQLQFPNDLVVGWQHTHPKLGVFLSAYDLFIHRHFFRQRWHIALVVDPVRQELGFFQWRDNDVVDCGFVLEE